jgi:iron complex transport system substrate-binding protein
LAGFPNTNFISSKKTRKLIDNNTVKDVGEKLNIEMLIEMSPELIVTFGIDNNPTIDNLTKSGLKVFIQAD